jgi:hypothetical protein
MDTPTTKKLVFDTNEKYFVRIIRRRLCFWGENLPIPGANNYCVMINVILVHAQNQND